MSQAPHDLLAPPTIAVSSTLWDLGADAAAIRRWARSLRSLAAAAKRSLDLVTTPADELYQRWHGTAASTWNSHRLALYADLRRMSGAAAGTSARLHAAAGILEEGQHRLTELHARAVALCPVTLGGPSMVFHPPDPHTATQVLGCVRDAERVRGGLVQALRPMPPSIAEHGATFEDIEATWGPDTSIVFTMPGKKGRRRPIDDEWDWVWHPRPLPRPDPPRRPPPRPDPGDDLPDDGADKLILGGGFPIHTGPPIIAEPRIGPFVPGMPFDLAP